MAFDAIAWSAMNDFKEPIEKFLGNRGSMFSFLLAPESYLLGAGLLSSLVSLLFLGLNAIALHCLATSCSALQEESNTVSSWLVFEGLTAFFVSTSAYSLSKFARIQKERSGER